MDIFKYSTALDRITSIKVVNIHRHHGAIDAVDAVVMRGKSQLANPYPMHDRSDTERSRVINEFRRYLFKRLQDKNSPQYREIKRLTALYKKQGSLTLACCCKPKPCHADVIKSAILNLSMDI